MWVKDTFFSENHSINCRGKLLDLSRPLVMGILNITPDSFYDGGKYSTSESIEMRVKKMMDEGAGIIDVGGISSRPGAKPVSPEEEWKRIRPALEIIRNLSQELPVSVDTFRTEIAEEAVKKFDVDIINDITGGKGDSNMLKFIAESRVPYILMHMKGTPESMQYEASYSDVVDEVLMFLQKQIHTLKEMGAVDIIVDPGFGFGKTLEHNYQILASLEVFKILEVPILVGVSRKSMIYKLLNLLPEESLNGTSALNMYALWKGAKILRVHDVKEAVEVVNIYNKIIEHE